MNLIQNNPYRTVGLLVGATAKEQTKQISRLKKYIEAEQDPQDDFSFPALGNLHRTIERVEEAASKLNLDNDKINAALFWFWNGNPITDEAAFEAELEDLIEKIKRNADDGNLNISQIESHLEEYRKKVEHIIKEKNIKEAKELTREIGQLDFELRNAVTGNAMDVQFLRHINDTFSSYHWKDANKARQLVNQGLQMATNGNTSGIRNILIQIIGLMPDNEKPTNTLR